MTATTTRRGGSRRRKPTAADVAAHAARKQALFDKLEAWQEDADEDDIAAAVAMFAAIEDGYSERNAMLIAMQDPQATKVAGYRQWQDAGRQVVAYPEGQGGITIVRFKGAAKDAAKDGAEAADGPPAADAPAETDATGDDAKKARNRFALTTVHDIRNTVAIVCGVCGEPIHRTGFDKSAGPRGRHTWTHTGNPQAGHTAELPRRDTDTATTEATEDEQ